VKEMIRYGFILALICVIAAGLLAGMNALTKSRIIAQAQAEEESSLKEVMPDAAKFEPVKSGEDILYYKSLDKGGKMVGVVFKASGKGYSSVVETMVGMLKDDTITAIKVLSQSETPGLGARVAEKEFTSQFKNKNAINLADVQAITGATISSKAVMDSVKEKAKEIKELIKNVPNNE
jgi:electron transport complex protein RnfG